MKVLVPYWSRSNGFSSINEPLGSGEYTRNKRNAFTLDPGLKAVIYSNDSSYLRWAYDTEASNTDTPWSTADEAVLFASDNIFDIGQGNTIDYESSDGSFADVTFTTLYGDGTLSTGQVVCTPEKYGRTVSLGITEDGFKQTHQVKVSSTGTDRDEYFNSIMHGYLIDMPNGKYPPAWSAPKTLTGFVRRVSPKGTPIPDGFQSQPQISRTVTLKSLTETERNNVAAIFETLLGAHHCWFIQDVTAKRTWFPTIIESMDTVEIDVGIYDVTLGLRGFAWL